MAKNKKKNKNPQVKSLQAETAKVQAEQAVEETVVPAAEPAENVAAEKVSAPKKDGKAVEVKAKDLDKKKKKEKNKKPNKVAKAIKDTGSELKKVTWPKFKEVVKQTGIVLVVVVVFALVLFGLDFVCSKLTGLLMP